MTQSADQTPVSEIMCQPAHCIVENQSLGELIALFEEKAISAAPVLSESGKPVGFVSKTDVVRKLKQDRHRDARELALVKVSDIMTPSTYSFQPTTNLADATAAMAFEGIHHLPIVDHSGKVVGILSALDILDWQARNAGYTPTDGQQGSVFKRPHVS